MGNIRLVVGFGSFFGHQTQICIEFTLSTLAKMNEDSSFVYFMVAVLGVEC